MAEIILYLSIVAPLWVIAWTLWRHYGAPGRKARARAVSFYHCSCAYLSDQELEERTGESPWDCFCATGCLVEKGAEDCPCGCRTRGCYQELVYQGFRE